MRRWPGAEFTFRYYDGQYATAAETEASGAPTRTWAFKTNEKGRIRIMDESLKVSGDDLFYNSMGQITLPIGTLLIQETKAPEGYLIDPTVYVRNITPDGTLEAVNSYNAPTVSEQVVTGRIQIVKHTDTGTTKVETPEVVPPSTSTSPLPGAMTLPLQMPERSSPSIRTASPSLPTCPTASILWSRPLAGRAAG